MKMSLDSEPPIRQKSLAAVDFDVSSASGFFCFEAAFQISCMQGEGDTVTASVLEGRPGEVVIESIEGDDGRLSLVAAENCVGIAAIETLKLLGKPTCGVSLKLDKASAIAASKASKSAHEQHSQSQLD